mmetsp:Transcript_100470/g.193968  ORF Transcript_100470/g.193968 Transcript_100470/m.193968 type:complete len:665 (+) Transcript_100470:98-2092(+)
MGDLGRTQQWEALLGFKPKLFNGCDPSGDLYHAIEGQHEEEVCRLDITDEDSVAPKEGQGTMESVTLGTQDQPDLGLWRTSSPSKRPRPSPGTRPGRSRQSLRGNGDTGSCLASPDADEHVNPEVTDVDNVRGQSLPPDSGWCPQSESSDMERRGSNIPQRPMRSCPPIRGGSNNRAKCKASGNTAVVRHEEHDSSPEQQQQHSFQERDSDEKQEDEAPLYQPLAPVASAAHSTGGRRQFNLAGDPLELLIAPGDVIMVRALGRLAELGTVGGFMGHVLLVIGVPVNVSREEAEASDIRGLWPAEQVTEIWRVPTVESTRRETGLYRSETVIYIQARDRQIKMIGEVDGKGEVSSCDQIAVELWQSPEEVRSELRADLMEQVVSDMAATQADWSATTAARAVVKQAAVVPKKTTAETLQDIQMCWHRPPICTSVVIAFWQRYVCRFAATQPLAQQESGTQAHHVTGERVMYWSESFRSWMDAVVMGHNLDANGAIVSYNLDCKVGAAAANIRRPAQVLDISVKAVELIIRCMPLKADRALPGDLVKSMRECGWVCVPQVPRVFRPKEMHTSSSAGAAAVASAAPVVPPPTSSAPPRLVASSSSSSAASVPDATVATPALEPPPMATIKGSVHDVEAGVVDLCSEVSGLEMVLPEEQLSGELQLL